MLAMMVEYCLNTSVIYCIISGVVSYGLWRILLKKSDDEGEIPKLTYKESELSSYLLKNCKELTKPFKPPFYARNCHIQTILPVLLPKPKYEYRRQYIKMEDGGQVALDWGVTGTENAKSDSTILLILPGLTGDGNGFKGLCKRASEQGLKPVVFNKRGHGNSILTTPKLQSFGDISDIKVCVEYIHDLYPAAKIVAIGHSAGSGLLACYTGTLKEKSLISAACCVSPGYDSLKLFSEPLPWPYDFLLLRGLKNLVKEHAHILSKAVDVNRALESKTIKDFDYRLYRILYDFPDLKSYWSENNPMDKVWTITVPCMCISSVNDPVIEKRQIPFEAFRTHSNFMLASTSSGGHCGYLGEGLTSWADIVALDYVITAAKYKES